MRIGNTVMPYIGVDVPRQVFGDPNCLKQVVLSVVKHCISTLPVSVRFFSSSLTCICN